MNAPNPGHILQVGLGFWASKALLSAVELDLFTHLATGSRTRATLEAELGLHARSSRDFLDVLVALGFLVRDGSGDSARYACSEETAMFLDRAQPTYVGGMLNMANDRLWRVWADLTEGLRSGLPQNEIKHTGRPVFEALYADAEGLEVFMRAMTGISMGPCAMLAEKFDWSRYKTLVDAGGATGLLSIQVARRHAHLSAVSVDLPAVEPIARKAIAAAGLGDRIRAASVDFFAEPLPRADVVVMGHILHNWNLDEKLQLVRRAYEALPAGGAFIAVDNIIDDARRENVFGLLVSLNMLLETSGGFDYTGADFAGWCRQVGFQRVEILPLAGPTSAGIAYK